MLKGNVFNIQRFCTDDGDGIRTVVFLKGCPLRCLWCQNPESQVNETVITFTTTKCIGCGQCVNQCKFDVREMVKDERDVFVKTKNPKKL